MHSKKICSLNVISLRKYCNVDNIIEHICFTHKFLLNNDMPLLEFIHHTLKSFLPSIATQNSIQFWLYWLPGNTCSHALKISWQNKLFLNLIFVSARSEIIFDFDICIRKVIQELTAPGVLKKDMN
jgi:hypothetical protein